MSGIRRSEKEAWTSFDSHEISRMACPKRNQFYGRIRVDSGAWIDIHWRHIGKSIDESCDVKSDSTIVLVLTLHFEPFTIARYSSARPYNPIQLVFFLTSTNDIFYPTNKLRPKRNKLSSSIFVFICCIFIWITEGIIFVPRINHFQRKDAGETIARTLK